MSSWRTSRRELADQLFKLKFQLKMGQTESLKKIRDLKKDIARIKTIEREKQQWQGEPRQRGEGGGEDSRSRQRLSCTGKEGGQEEDGCNGEEVSHGRDNDRNHQHGKEAGRRKTLIGEVVSTKMAKTIVVEVNRQKAHPFYKRVVKRSKKFYAHDEQGTAKLGDLVKIEETRPLSKLKRWQLKDIVRRAAQVAVVEAAPTV